METLNLALRVVAGAVFYIAALGYLRRAWRSDTETLDAAKLVALNFIAGTLIISTV